MLGHHWGVGLHSLNDLSHVLPHPLPSLVQRCFEQAFSIPTKCTVGRRRCTREQSSSPAAPWLPVEEEVEWSLTLGVLTSMLISAGGDKGKALASHGPGPGCTRGTTGQPATSLLLCSPLRSSWPPMNWLPQGPRDGHLPADAGAPSLPRLVESSGQSSLKEASAVLISFSGERTLQ